MTSNVQGTDARLFQTSQIHYRYIDLDATNGTFDIGYIPKGAVVIGAYAAVSEAYDAATSATVSIGTSAEANAYLAAVDVKSAGLKEDATLATSIDIGPLGAATMLTASVATSGAGSAGACRAIISYIAELGG